MAHDCTADPPDDEAYTLAHEELHRMRRELTDGAEPGELEERPS